MITEEPKSAVYRDIKAYMDVDDQGDEREVAPEDIVKSYVYGDKIIPFPSKFYLLRILLIFPLIMCYIRSCYSFFRILEGISVKISYFNATLQKSFN